MNVVESLPPRPLTTAEVESISASESVEGAAPVSGMPLLDRVYAIFLVGHETTYGLGFDDERGSWVLLEQASNDLGGEATGRVDSAIHEWAEETYGEKFGYFQTEV